MYFIQKLAVLKMLVNIISLVKIFSALIANLSRLQGETRCRIAMTHRSSLTVLRYADEGSKRLTRWTLCFIRRLRACIEGKSICASLDLCFLVWFRHCAELQTYCATLYLAIRNVFSCCLMRLFLKSPPLLGDLISSRSRVNQGHGWQMALAGF